MIIPTHSEEEVKEEDEEGIMVSDDSEAEELDMASQAPAVLPDNFGGAQTQNIHMADVRDDMSLRDLISMDLLNFEWASDPQNFKGSRDFFTGKAGPTFSDYSDPLDVFRKIWDDDLIDFIVTQTNKYAALTIAAKGPLLQKSRLRTWIPTDRVEILRFLAIYQLHSLNHFPIQNDYFKSSENKVQFISMAARGGRLALFRGHGFCKQSIQRNGVIRYRCSSYVSKKCKAAINVDSRSIVVKALGDHNHEKYQYVQVASGKYTTVRIV
ncbi:Uncharacterized protein OBRU01_19860 [Operophtera brumata]|uniref:Modifier of mdg4 n=1 Tax=Operophtera brumata TaxID=104452 RepID=A0A0L7KUS0_OPEBR|nr:Uncharacterized protein OBRU01_19860 [Operophtera brumata]